MKKLLIVALCVLSVACATGGAFASKSKPEQAKTIMLSFQASWDEACTQEWLRCDVTAYADTVVAGYVAAVDAHPETWQSAADAAIDAIKARAMSNDLLGRWVAWLDLARFAVDTLK